ncbi:beta-galactosidase [Candidatus Sulfidibacterium hydrothermale]|uniref:glycoside hydrolase family 35 protein n=1 Tax=Candidatus Sulfidibacterium hydrothermale TaxID=2875962 RepID=UPI001F0B6912|nr:glycoside hydrolase family 35 protein [Candidatus Sulfidibacterium hydrothermale]UBM62621.1 beta-galactosidase [Candidatus Sulfidibacterium hydrothermale]
MRIPARFFVLGGFLFLLLAFPFGGYSQTFSSGQPVLHTFQIDSSQFLLDGKPFEIIAGEMHYARIPACYWKQRIEMAKAMGCNAISTYVFWNYHEQQPGHFDFKTGNRDLAHFIQLVQDAGMWLLIRPGPYVCAEWDFGGLPPYLLSIPDIKLRCSDARYMQAVKKYIDTLANVLRPYQITRGGPIILLQIENEYGSYGNDRSYLKTLEKLWRKNGINIPFYTADGGTPYMLEAGSLPGCAVGLDPGGYEKAIRLAQKINPGVPVFSSETYTGWLTHWREKWAKADTADLYKEVRFLLEHHRSLSFYVVHGGTNFGFTAGANASGQRFQPDVTSYDYAAPITETGRPTAEFFRLRQLIHQYHPETKLLPVPAAPPLISIPEVEMKVFSSVWANLPKPVHSVQPRPFEYYGQYHGYMMYQTRLIGRKSGKLVLTQLHDYATVFLNGKYIGSIDRTKGQNSIVLPKTKARVPLLQILIEAMGHVNYGSQLIDRKGITERATLNGMTLMNWEVYGLPFGASYLKHLIPDHDVSRPGVFFRGTFQLDKTGDTYFDLSRYQKGLVWVNGHLLGRYWNVGPQHSLYCPASFLKKGRNEILIFDLHQIHPMPVKGIRKLL